jgi:hypothetical protein
VRVILITCIILTLGTCAGLWLKTVTYNSVGPIFWVPLVLLVALTGSVIIFRREEFVHLCLLALIGPLASILLYPQLFQLPSYDAYFDVSYAQTIVANARWDPTLGTGYAKASGYGYYPSFHLVLSAWSIVSGVPILSLMKYFAPLLFALVVVGAAVLLFRQVFPMEKATLVGLMYVTSLGFVGVFPSRRAIALVQGVLAIAVIFSKTSIVGNTRSRAVAITILLATLSFSDHFIGAVVLGSAIIASIVLRLRKLEEPGAPLGLLYLGAVTFGAWWTLTAYNLFILDVDHMQRFWHDLLTLGVLQAAPTSLYGYSALERALPIVSWGIFGVLGLTGLLISLLRSHRISQSLVWGTLGLLMSGLATVMALHPVYHVFTDTILWFAAMLLAGPAASAMVKLARLFPRSVPRIIPVVLLIIVFSGSLISVYGARALDRSPNESRLIEEARGFSAEHTILGNWLEPHLEPNVTVMGDEGSFILFSSMNGIGFIESFSWPANPGQFAALQSTSQHYVIWGTCSVTCGSVNYEGTASPVVSEDLSNYNRLWDGGQWQILYPPAATGS